MAKHGHDEEEDLHFEGIEHKGVQYEDRDLGARGIIVFLVVLVISAVVICAMVWGYFDYRAKRIVPAEKIPGPQAVYTPEAEESAPAGRFPKPSLQIDDVSDMNQVREANRERLSSYGYIDQKGGIVHIPIAAAMDQLAKQGLPTRGANNAQPVSAAGQKNAAQANAQTPGAVADFGSGDNTVAGAAGGVRPANNQ
jgi:hypothetical protein